MMRTSTRVSFGPFLLQRKLTASGILDLWLAEFRGHEGHCLVRRLLPPFSQGEEFRQLFIRRTQRVQSLPQGGLISVLEVGDAETIPYVRLQYVHGWRVVDVIEQASSLGADIPVGPALEIVLGAVRTLLELLELPEGAMTHGAVRPESIWVTEGGHVQVGDLEIGPLAETELESSELHPDRAWRFQAPERRENWEEAPASADVYSLAAILLEMLAVGRMTEVQLQALPKNQLPLLEGQGVPHRLTALLSTALATAPADRPTLATFAEELDVVRAGLKDVLGLTTYLDEELERLEGPQQYMDHDAEPVLAEGFAFDEGSGDVAAVEMPNPERSPRKSSPLLLGAAVIMLMLLAVVGVLYQGPLRSLLFAPGAEMVLVTADSSPALAMVYSSTGQELGRTPLKIPLRADADGSISLSAGRTGFRTQGPLRREVPLSGKVHFAFVLEPEVIGFGRAKVVTVPPGATITVDGKKRGKSPVLVEDLMSNKEHELEVMRKGYAPVHESFAVEVDDVTDLEFTLIRKKHKNGRKVSASNPTSLSSTGATGRRRPKVEDAGLPVGYSGAVGWVIVESQPWAHVYVDNLPRGITQGGRKIDLPVGRHVIQYRSWDLNQTVQHSLRIRAGETKVLNYDFENRGWRIREYRPF